MKIEVPERRTANNRLRGIDNPYSYLRSLLRNDSGADDSGRSAEAAIIRINLRV
jgi:hypothetical protein